MSISTFMPLETKRTGGHKVIIAPTCDTAPDTMLLQSLVKAHLWQRQLRTRKYTVADIAQKYSIHKTYVQRIMRLNLLAPLLKVQILQGVQPRHVRLNDLVKGVPLLWVHQIELFQN